MPEKNPCPLGRGVCQSQIAELRALAGKWKAAAGLMGSVSSDDLAPSPDGSKEDAFARMVLGNILAKGRDSLPEQSKASIDGMAIRLFRDLIPDFELPSIHFSDPAEYAESLISKLPQLQVGSVVKAADQLFKYFHPEGRGMFESKQTSKGYLFTFPAYFDELLDRLSYGTAESNMERAKALWIVHEQLCPLAPFDLSELESAFRTQHRPVFTRQAVRVSTFATVTLFKSTIKFELSLEALETLQLIWDEHGCQERLAA